MFMNYLGIDVPEEREVPVDKAVADVDLDKYMMEEMVANGLEDLPQLNQQSGDSHVL